MCDPHNHRIQLFSSNNKFSFKFGSNGEENGQFQYAHGLKSSNRGKLMLVCDDDNHRIQVFNAINVHYSIRSSHCQRIQKSSASKYLIDSNLFI